MNADIEQMLLRGHEAQQAGRLAEAEKTYLEVLERDRRNVHALNLLGALCVNTGRADEAVYFITKAIKQEPRNPQSHANLALAFKDQGKLERAEHHFRQSLALDPSHPMVHNNLGNVLRGLDRPREAVEVYERALKQAPEFPECWSNLSAALCEAGKLKRAHQAVDRALAMQPGLAEAHNNRGDILLAEARYEEAIESYKQAIALFPRYTAALINMARTQRDMDQPEQALKTLEEVLSISPGNPSALHVRGVLYEQMGQPDKAAESFKEAIDSASDLTVAHYYLANLRGRKTSDEEFEAMHAQWKNPRLTPNNRMYLAFALARVHEQRGDIDRAYDFIAKGNRIKADMTPYDDAETERFTMELADATEDCVQRNGAPVGALGQNMLFVLGMPRSGTSLTEQILASHSKIAGAGELSYAYDTAHRVRTLTREAFPGNIRLLSPAQLRELGDYYLSRHKVADLDSELVVDKTPLNFQYIGLLALALPGARFIHCHRDPVQNCFSIHKIPFDQKQAYAHDLQALGLYYQKYWALMQRWKVLFPGRIIDVRYEDLVGETEAQARRLLDFIGLEFEPDVLQYHRSERLVKTPSASQVRQPIYTDALQSWRRYESHLGPLRDALGPLNDDSAQSLKSGR